MPRALLLGGTGQIGLGVAPHLVRHGWDVTVASRTGTIPPSLAPLGITSARVDRSIEGQLEAAVGDQLDLLVDIVAFTEPDAQQLNALAGRIGSVVAISSASVYVDTLGRSLDEARSLDTCPALPVPTSESQDTVRPADDPAASTYSTHKVAMERALLEGPLPATILRPGAIHGPGAALPRELFFVKRIVDGRKHVALIDNGNSRFHTTSVANLAELIRLAAQHTAQHPAHHTAKRILNATDPDAPTVREIGEAISDALDHPLEHLLVPGLAYDSPQLANPWAVARPMVLDMTAAQAELGYHPITTYAQAVRDTAEWLATEIRRGRSWEDTYLNRYFNYAAEDELVTSRS